MVNFANLENAYDIPSKQISATKKELGRIRDVISKYENNNNNNMMGSNEFGNPNSNITPSNETVIQSKFSDSDIGPPRNHRFGDSGLSHAYSGDAINNNNINNNDQGYSPIEHQKSPSPNDIPQKMYPRESSQTYDEYQRQQAMFYVAQLLQNPFFQKLMAQFNKGHSGLPGLFNTMSQGVKERFGFGQSLFGTSDSLLCDEIRNYIGFFFVIIIIYLVLSLLLTYSTRK